MMTNARAATERLNIAMLQVDLLKAKYGITWLPSVKTETPTAAGSAPAAADAKPTELAPSVQILLPTVTNKRHVTGGVDRDVRDLEGTSDHAPVWISLKKSK